MFDDDFHGDVLAEVSAACAMHQRRNPDYRDKYERARISAVKRERERREYQARRREQGRQYQERRLHLSQQQNHYWLMGYLEMFAEGIGEESGAVLKEELTKLREEIGQLRADLTLETALRRGEITELKTKAPPDAVT
jgi:hypothetical protein